MLVTGLLMARAMGPGSYGNYTFLLGSFTAILQVMDMGASTAFYTFLSQRPRGARFITWYLGWQGLQLLVPLVCIVAIFPSSWMAHIWLGQDRDLVALAFFAIFLQQQVWQTVNAVTESRRLSHHTQVMNLSLALVNFGAVLTCWRLGILTVRTAYGLLVVEYAIAIGVGYWVLCQSAPPDVADWNGKDTWRAYAKYCGPLAVSAWLTAAYTFADAWLLQHFGGPRQQAFYAVGGQFAAISLLATVAMLRIFWKEVAEAHHDGNHERVFHLYQRISRGLFLIGAACSGFLIPWSATITSTVLGPAYVPGAIVLAVMFLYPPHQSMGQIVGTMYYATADVRPQVIIGLIVMSISIPVSYVLQAPPSAHIPGFGLGGLGMAAKIVGLNILSVNLSAWWLARTRGWKYDWSYQIIALGGAVGLGWIAHGLASALGRGGQLPMFVLIASSLVIYGCGWAAAVWYLPWLGGVSRPELRRWLRIPSPAQQT